MHLHYQQHDFNTFSQPEGGTQQPPLMSAESPRRLRVVNPQYCIDLNASDIRRKEIVESL